MSARIVAVFGGSDDAKVRDLAERLGAEIARANLIVLTGGEGPEGDEVKHRALLGADPHPWIGIPRKKSARTTWTNKPPHAFRIFSDLGHKRNFLEAYMCDAAIVLEGQEGTQSEAASALSLHRPVAFVRGDWRSVFDLDADRAGAIGTLLSATEAKFGGKGGSKALERYLKSASIREGLEGDLCYRYFGPEDDAATVVQWIRERLAERPAVRRSATLGVTGEVAAAYKRWRARIACR